MEMAKASTQPSGKDAPGTETKVPHLRLVFSQKCISPEVIDHPFPGSGTEIDPYMVDWLPNDPRNPHEIATGMKWLITMIMAFGTLSISMSSSIFSGALPQIGEDFDVSRQLSVASISLFVLGFAVGPMSWAPLSEIYGRQIIYAITFTLATVFGGASIASKNIATLLVLRFFTGVCGSSAIVNAAGVISDMFEAKDRGLAVMVYTSAPFLGPSLGPICGGFLAQSSGWRWVDGLTVIFTGVMLILGLVLVPETYGPYLLMQRAKYLSKFHGKVCISKLEAGKPNETAGTVLRNAIARPWAILFLEPIVTLLSIYSAIVYGILYLIFTAFPIIFQGQRHWSQGVAGLSYVGVMVGQILAMIIYAFMETSNQKRISKEPSRQTPEARLDPAILGGVLLPMGLFWFAWTTLTSIHWAVSIVGSTLFGIGQVLLFISLINYIIDTYTVFSASALAGAAILRALFGAAFPLFTTNMYERLGIQWGSSVPAFLALACAPMPFFFRKFGRRLRERSKLAQEAHKTMTRMMTRGAQVVEKELVVSSDGRFQDEI
ncbi:hypothetical protein PFICI_12919 [Pestalotiopsis fici W106-1]|uniref:Major facilitator superfamily (MFS) profile domain-containing protein n=1 Tax=Pestalotiopsis fici (strain W106-1 / CGMCC3.15140) TaxID=1229662 RepID=W3WQ05_PESFW|nr:uncharacterized protein PFICI_12919 [Pestalotiopsis fici W106-1]ETS75975.1 hypothetical protein PFICI_12919 [Pestalotiopsis fici W106-1]